MSPPLFVQHYSQFGLPYIRQIWRASRLKFVFNRTPVDQALLWISENPTWQPSAPASSCLIADADKAENKEDSVASLATDDFISWLTKRASSLGLARALEKSAHTNNGSVLKGIVPHLDPKMDLSDLVTLSAQSQKWEAVTILCGFARPVSSNTALISAVKFGQIGLIPALVPTSSPSVIHRALNTAAKTKQPSAVSLLINHCAEWARTDALGQALLNNCVDSVHMLAPLSDCWLIKDWAQTSLKQGWEEGAAAIALSQYMPPKAHFDQKFNQKM